MQKILRNTAIVFVFISLLLHFGAFTGLTFVPKGKFFERKDKKVEIVIIEQDNTQRPVENQARQIVDSMQKPINNEVDPEAKYLSQFNQTVKKETKAQSSGVFDNSAGSGGAQKSPTQAKAQQDPQKPSQKVSKTEKNQKRPKSKVKAFKDGDLPTLSALSPQYEPKYTPPTDLPVAQAGRPSQTPDYLKEDKGMQTLLSTREFVYYAYYKRIRQKIRQYWEPSIKQKVEKIFAQGRSIASTRDRITKVVIILDGSGALVNVQIVGESGIKDLDEAAIEAFRAAEPFPNPPDGIIEQDGKIRIRWDFVLEANNSYSPMSEDEFVVGL